MRLKGEKAEICYEETKEFFKKRACKYNPENPYSVTMYQDEHKELVTERNRKEIEILYPWLGIGKSSRILMWHVELADGQTQCRRILTYIMG